MALSKCPRCDTVFSLANGTVCRKCRTDEERDYELLKGSLEKHPGLSAGDLARTAGVQLEVVLRMLDAGLITYATEFGPVKCGQCGSRAVAHGRRLCSKCLENLTQKAIAAQKTVRSTRQKLADAIHSGDVRELVADESIGDR